jgi:hypothetical protein
MSTELPKAWGGPILWDIIDRMKRKVAGKSWTRYKVYSTVSFSHDSSNDAYAKCCGPWRFFKRMMSMWSPGTLLSGAIRHRLYLEVKRGEFEEKRVKQWTFSFRKKFFEKVHHLTLFS